MYVQQEHPAFILLFVLWAAMARVVSLAEWSGRWILGLLVAVGGGILGYAVLGISETPGGAVEAMTSLGLAAIIYGVLRYLVSRARG